MPKFTFTSPDGKNKYTVTGPEGATAEQAFKILQTQLATKAPEYNPTDDMGTGERVLAGVGKAFVDTGRGVGQLLGMVSDEDVKDARRYDAPLMNTTAGKVGNIGGHIAVAAPAMFVPGANTVAGAGAIGAAQGFIQPVTEDESRLKNAAIGGASGVGGVVAGRAIGAAASGAKALVEPFVEAGRAKIAGRVLKRFAEDPQGIASAAGGRTITGAMPTLAEVTGDAGVARLQDALRSVDPQINNMLLSRLSENNAARVNSLMSLAGDSAKRQAAEGARTVASSDLYRQATTASYKVDGELADILSRPAVKQAMARAEALAANQGRPFSFSVNSAPHGEGTVRAGSRQITGQGLQDLKMAMDEMLTDPSSGFVGAAGNTVKNLRGQIVDWMERANPDFKAARQAYAAASKPLNGMDVGEQIAKKALSNTSDLAGNQRLQANALLSMLRDEPKLVQQAIGKKGVNSLDDVFTPDQLNLLRTVASESDRAAAVGAAGAGPGAATAQRLASQNIIRQILGPTGLPESWAESALANTVIGKPFNLLYGGVAEPKIQQALAEAVLNPETAKVLLRGVANEGARGPQNALTRLLAGSARLTPSAVAVSGQR